MRRLVCLVISLMASLPAPAAGWADALELAWARHPEAGAQADRQAAAQAAGARAQALTPGPGSLSLGNIDDRVGSDRGRREWEIELATPLWLPGQRGAQAAEADAALNELAARRQAARLQLAGELRHAWWTLAAARAERDLSQRRLDSARALETDVLRRYQAGDLARVDANLAGDQRLAAEVALDSAGSRLARAELAWRQLTGAAPPDALPAEADIPVAATDHPRLRALEAAARLAHARLKLSRETRRESPELALRLIRERGDAAEAYGNSLGIKLTWPLSGAALNRQADASARAEAAQADAELALARLNLERETLAVRQELAASQRRVGLAQARQALSVDTLALAEKAFALGETDLQGLLRSRAAAHEAESARLQAGIERHAAQAELHQTLGILP